MENYKQVLINQVYNNTEDLFLTDELKNGNLQLAKPLLNQMPSCKTEEIEEQYIPIQQNHLQMTPLHETQIKFKEMSPFHNFQKHLITFIKNFTNFTPNNVESNHLHQLKSYLWTLFLKTKSYKKRILLIIFGVKGEYQSKQQIDKLCRQFPILNQIFEKNTMDEVAQAQKLIREQVVLNSQRITKQFMNCNCKITKIEQFYDYYISFIIELKNGPISRRMTKKNSCVFQKLISI